jgi:hypothetical protein
MQPVVTAGEALPPTLAIRSSGFALVDQVVAFLADSGRLAAGSLESAPRRVSASGSAARTG